MAEDKKNNGVIFLKDWKILVFSLAPENQLVFWDLFTGYEYGSDQVCENQFVFPIWNFIKSQLDNMKTKYNETIVVRNQTNGLKGGRPKKETQRNFENPKNPMGYLETQKTPNDNDNNNNNDVLLEKEPKGSFLPENPEDKNPETEPSKKVAQKKVSFRPPDPAEVQRYCDERKNEIIGQEFCDYYTAKGWMVGKNKMKDWQAAVRTWEKYRNNGATNNKHGNGKISGTAAIIAGLDYTEFA